VALGFAEIADIADMIAFAVLVHVLPVHRERRESFDALERLDDRARILSAAA
jgi:hypothetical protein